MGIRRYEITDEQWERIKDMLPAEHPKFGKRGRPSKIDNRSKMNGILWIAKSGAPWRELPERYGPWQTVYACFCKWKNLGVFERIFHTIRRCGYGEHQHRLYFLQGTSERQRWGEKLRIKLSAYPRAVGIPRFIRLLTVWVILLPLCSVPATSMIPNMPSLCSRKSASKAATSWVIKPMGRRQSVIIYRHRRLHTRFRLRATAKSRGLLTGIHTRNVIWSNASSSKSNGSVGYSPDTTSWMIHSWLSFLLPQSRFC